MMTSQPNFLPLKLLSRLLTILTILLRVALWPLGRIAYLAFPPKEFDGVHSATNADRAARAFVAFMKSHISVVRPLMGMQNSNRGDGVNDGNVGSRNNSSSREAEEYTEPDCPFVTRGYTTTLTEIQSRAPHSPLMLIYLHSPLHADGTKFIRNFLCHPRLLELLNGRSDSVTCFGASVHSADGARLREMMDVTSFPFLALINVKSTGSASSINNNNNNNVTLELLLRMEGHGILNLPPAQLINYLTTAITHHAESLAQAELRRLQREEEIRLREEQDREYQEALMADQIRETQRREAEEEARRREEEKIEEERQRVEKEKKWLEDAKALMKESKEPAAGSNGVARLRFTLPNGKKVDRRFRCHDKLEVVRAFLIVYFHEQSVDLKNFGLSMNFPKRTFREGDWSLTLMEAGLTPQAVVMVQDLDA